MSCNNTKPIIVTAGDNYLDIDAYACIVALRDLLQLKGNRVLAYSAAKRNYSVCDFLVEEGQIAKSIPDDFYENECDYIIVDVSDPDFIKASVPLERVSAVYDHHTGFEEYWKKQIADRANIEFIGAAATLIYREWKQSGLQQKMKPSTARLLVAAILDNTLSLTSANTTQEDMSAYKDLLFIAGLNEEWQMRYFSAVQKTVEADLYEALFKDIKEIRTSMVLPAHIAQLCVWDARSILEKVSEVRIWLDRKWQDWMINIIDLSHHCCYFICNHKAKQKKIETVFEVTFKKDIAVSEKLYLRKEIIKKAESYKRKEENELW